MWNLFKSTGVIEGVANGANKIIKTFRGSKSDRDKQYNERYLANVAARAAEFNYGSNRNWFDSLIDGFNRLPRPITYLAVIGYIYLAYKNPIEFQRLNVSLDTVPEVVWKIILAVIGSLFVARELHKKRGEKLALSKEEFNEVQRRLAELDPAAQVKKGPDLPLWYQIAKKEMDEGVKEITGNEDNPRIVEYHAATTLKASDDETPWCSAFVNWCMDKAGEVKTNKANARSWLNWGVSLDKPVQGCVVVFSRGSKSWQGHVGFYEGSAGDQVLCLGGNQSNEVNISSYAKSRVLGYRWPVDRQG